MKVQSKELKLPTLVDTVAYAGLFLIGKPLKWFKSYFLEF